MTETFDKLKAMLEDKKTLSAEDIQKMVSDHGEMTPDEAVELEAKKLEVEKANKTDEVSLDDYLAALKVLDNAAEGSDEYKQAEATVDKYEAGM